MKLKNLRIGTGQLIWLTAAGLFGMVSIPLFFAGLIGASKADNLFEVLSVITVVVFLLVMCAATLYFSVPRKINKSGKK